MKDGTVSGRTMPDLPWPLVLLAVLSILLLLVALRPVGAFWTVDNGQKYLLAHAIAHGSVLRPSLEDAREGTSVEAARDAGRWEAIRPPFAQRVDGRLVSQYPPAFSAATAGLLALFGDRALLVLPLAGALATVLAVVALARAAGAPAGASAALAMPLGPLLLYGALLWEQTLAAALVAWGAALWVRALDRHGGAIGAGLLLGIAVWLREETILLAVVALGLGAGARRWRLVLAMGGGLTLALLPHLLWQAVSTGNPLGLRLGGNVHAASSIAGLVSGRVDVAWTLLLACGREPATALPVAIAGLVGLGGLVRWAGDSTPRRLVGIATALALVPSAAALVAVLRAPWPPFAMMNVSGLLAFCPWLVLIAGDRTALRTPLVRLALIGLALLVLVTPRVTAHGVHWGPRILLSCVPLLAPAAALGARRWVRNGRLPLLALVLAVAATVQLGGAVVQTRTLQRIGDILERTRGVLAGVEPSTPIVTDLWWYAQQLAPLYIERPIAAAQTADELAGWIDAHPGERFVWASRRDPEGPRRWGAATATPVDIDGGGLGHALVVARAPTHGR